MPFSAESELALDECLDRLLVGEDWSCALPEGDTSDIRGLMDVAQKLLTIARQAPHLDGHQSQRIWSTAKAGAGRGPEPLAAVIAACTTLIRLLAGNEHQPFQARERARVRDVWR